MVSAVLTLVPLAVSVFSGEYILGQRYAAVIALLGAGGLLLGRIPTPTRVQKNEALVVVALAFLTTPLVMAWPMMASGLGFVDAFFEAVSAVTTTGLSTTASVEDKPLAFLFGRAWMQWYGGLGVVILALAIVVQPGSLAKRLSVSEVDARDPVGGTRAHFQRITAVYLLLTVAGVSVLCLLGISLLDAVLYSFAAVSTGGFAPHDQSLAALGAGPVVVTTLLCVAASLVLMRYHRIYRDGWGQFLADRQLWALFILIFLQAAALTWVMGRGAGLPWAEALWHGSMMAASAQSTAGFSTTPVGALDPVAKAVMILGMFVGGGSGSTAGGVKLLRLLILLSLIGTMLRRTTMPARAVWHPRLGRNRLDDGEIQEALTIIALAGGVIALSWLPFLALGYDALDGLFEVTSATSTVGLSTGLSGPDLPAALKLVLCMDMLLGRLEIVAWLVLFYPRTWLGRRMQATASEKPS